MNPDEFFSGWRDEFLQKMNEARAQLLADQIHDEMLTQKASEEDPEVTNQRDATEPPTNEKLTE